MNRLTLISASSALLLITTSASGAETVAKKGEELFNDFGCAGCHIVGQAWTAPDLTNITVHYEKERLVDYIANTEKHYDEPVVKAMAERYARYMSDQDVSRQEAEAIYAYLRTLATRLKK